MRVTCSCGKVLKVADELAGKKVRCPGCRDSRRRNARKNFPLEVVEDLPEEPPLVPPKRVRRPEPEPDEEEQDEEEPRPRRKKKRQPEPSFWNPWGKILVSVGIVLVTTGALLYILHRKGYLWADNKPEIVYVDGDALDRLTKKPAARSGPDKTLPTPVGVFFTPEERKKATDMRAIGLSYMIVSSSLQRPPANMKELTSGLDPETLKSTDFNQYGINWKTEPGDRRGCQFTNHHYL